MALAVDLGLENVGRLENHHPARGDWHFLSRLWVPADSLALDRTMNDPNDDSFTVSPSARQSVISFSTSSTSWAGLRPRQAHLLDRRFRKDQRA